jgi:hypothetical protein
MLYALPLATAKIVANTPVKSKNLAKFLAAAVNAVTAGPAGAAGSDGGGQAKQYYRAPAHQ